MTIFKPYIHFFDDIYRVQPMLQLKTPDVLPRPIYDKMIGHAKNEGSS